MKVEWSEGDVKPGRRYGKPGVRERHLIGYITPPTGPQVIVSVSLSDGQTSRYESRASLAALLTEQNYLPEELLPPA